MYGKPPKLALFSSGSPFSKIPQGVLLPLTASGSSAYSPTWFLLNVQTVDLARHLLKLKPVHVPYTRGPFKNQIQIMNATRA